MSGNDRGLLLSEISVSVEKKTMFVLWRFACKGPKWVCCCQKSVLQEAVCCSKRVRLGKQSVETDWLSRLSFVRRRNCLRFVRSKKKLFAVCDLVEGLWSLRDH